MAPLTSENPASDQSGRKDGLDCGTILDADSPFFAISLRLIIVSRQSRNCCSGRPDVRIFGPSFRAIGATRYISTGMLLCSFELRQVSCTSGEWTQHVDGMKTVNNASSIKLPLRFSSDMAVRLDQLDYCNVPARFSQLHSKRDRAPELPSTPIDHIYPPVRI